MSEPVGVQVRVKGGLLEGARRGGVLAFLGIPYSAAPFGADRLRPPQPVEPWDGARAASELGPTVPKADYVPMYVPLFPEVTIAGEDCLNLNVWAPDNADAAPVLVWIHGGAFTNGSNSVPEYDGSAFARDGIVFVGINYRLAGEGFLYTGEQPANLGLLDQIAALAWVRDNIAAFGGDPNRVTIAGESAGAWCVNTLLAAPAADGLFAQAISQSGGAHHWLTPEQGLLVASEIANALGVSPTRAALATVEPAALAEACRDLITEIQTAPDPVKWGQLALSQQPYAPTVDGHVLPGPTLARIDAGAGAGIRLLIGTTAQEARLILVAARLIDAIDDAALAQAAAGYGLTAAAVEVYRANRPGATPGDLLSAIVSDWYFRIPSIRVAEARPDSRTWMYRFDWASPTIGSGHGVDVPFAFDTLTSPGLAARLGDTPPQAVADLNHRIWIQFIATGDPGWGPYNTHTRATGLINDTLTVLDDPAGEERELWTGLR
jgi:para-nitrobenzyl esterase